MRLDPNELAGSFHRARAGKESRHSVDQRTAPSLFQYDYLALKTLSEDVSACVSLLPDASPGATALDLGAGKSPYRALLEARGYVVSTLDLTTASGADYAGSAEDTGLADGSFDVVLATQVLEHTTQPWRAVTEIRRILKPGGHFIGSAPHVWFYHPHPADCWRFTQEGVVRLCREAGLEPLELRGQGGSILTAFQIWNFLLYGVTGRAGAPLFALGNFLGRGLDAILPNDLFCHNFAWLARRA